VLGHKELKRIADRVLKGSTADQTEVSLSHKTEYLTRFAANTVHQNVAETNTTVRVRAVIGRRTGVASGNQVDDASLTKLTEAAERFARLQPDTPGFTSLPEPAAATPATAFVEATAACSPERRADGAAAIIDQARIEGLQASGAFSTEAQEVYVGSSLGVDAYHPFTVSRLLTVVMGDSGSGSASEAALDVNRLDPQAIGRVAVDKALRSRNPSGIEPGDYTVLLEEDAVADMLFFLGWMGLGALSLQEQRSFLSGRLGERVTGENITLWDDGNDPRTIPFPFDFEGHPRQKVMLIEQGVAKGVVYDSFTAGREPGRTSTGHSLPAPNTMGPVPAHLFLAPGETTKEEMLATTDRGIWVTRFHYTNPVHPVKTVLTGMTRDGTFLIENGRLTRPLKNLRFTQSILDALCNTDMLGSTLKLHKLGFGPFAVCAPAIRVKAFTFTGTTQF